MFSKLFPENFSGLAVAIPNNFQNFSRAKNIFKNFSEKFSKNIFPARPQQNPGTEISTTHAIKPLQKTTSRTPHFLS